MRLRWGTPQISIPVEGWEIINGKLYLNYSREIQEKWVKDIPGYIKKAAENWPSVLE